MLRAYLLRVGVLAMREKVPQLFWNLQIQHQAPLFNIVWPAATRLIHLCRDDVSLALFYFDKFMVWETDRKEMTLPMQSSGRE
jgi:hypothetical protein